MADATAFFINPRSAVNGPKLVTLVMEVASTQSTALHSTSVHCTAQQSTALHSTALHRKTHTSLHSTALHSTALQHVVGPTVLTELDCTYICAVNALCMCSECAMNVL